MAGLKPWREVITPHADVASGRYQQAEFAADLWQVHLGEGTAEYTDPAEFFRRTYLTDSLKRQADDENATSPGDVLGELFDEYGPCLVLIDEWVAYARQLHDQSDLPAGSFETQFTFAHALTEAAKAAGNCLLVISLPASDSGAHPMWMTMAAVIHSLWEKGDRNRHIWSAGLGASASTTSCGLAADPARETKKWWSRWGSNVVHNYP